MMQFKLVAKPSVQIELVHFCKNPFGREFVAPHILCEKEVVRAVGPLRFKSQQIL